MDVALDTIEALQQEGAIQSELDQERVWILSQAIKQPIEDQIFMTQRDYLWTGWWMPLIGLALLVLAWWPDRNPKQMR